MPATPTASAPDRRAPLARMTPIDLLRVWPIHEPLAALISGSFHPRWARWSMLARPATIHQFTDADDPLQQIDALLKRTASRRGNGKHQGRWIINLSYELGRIIEPAVAQQRPPIDDRRQPLVQMAWCPDLLIYDHLEAKWHTVGEPYVPEAVNSPDDDVPRETSVIESSVSRDEYMRMVEQTLDYIAAGDIFQANITQRLTTDVRAQPRHLAADLFAQSGAWYGAAIDVPGFGHVLSLSPELFLETVQTPDAGRRGTRITTRPIKGTSHAGSDPDELRASAKDTAELHMIVDLMRNDLGRVCEQGSVRVDEARAIETHHAVHQGVATVSGELRGDVSFVDVLRATFPAGSVTGVPKIRAMQIIEELEPVQRGQYCGSIGWIDAETGTFGLNVAIRTLLLSGRKERYTVDYGAGGGVVADSVPADEYAESLAKAAVMRQSRAAL